MHMRGDASRHARACRRVPILLGCVPSKGIAYAFHRVALRNLQAKTHRKNKHQERVFIHARETHTIYLYHRVSTCPCHSVWLVPVPDDHPSTLHSFLWLLLRVQTVTSSPFARCSSFSVRSQR